MTTTETSTWPHYSERDDGEQQFYMFADAAYEYALRGHDPKRSWISIEEHLARAVKEACGCNGRTARTYVFERIQCEGKPSIKVVQSGHSDEQIAIESMRAQIRYYLTKTIFRDPAAIAGLIRSKYNQLIDISDIEIHALILEEGQRFKQWQESSGCEPASVETPMDTEVEFSAPHQEQSLLWSLLNLFLEEFVRSAGPTLGQRIAKSTVRRRA